MSVESVAESMPPGYKQTEVGVIPEDWYLVTIGDFAIKVGSGITPRGGNSNYKEYGRPFVRSQNVGWGTLLLNDLVYIDDDTHKSFSSTELRQGDVLLNITGASIGRSAIAEAHLAGGNVNQHVCIIRTDTSKVVSLFLNYIILSSQGQRQIDSFQAGGNREGLNFGQIRSIRFPLPPTLAEQEAIATALSDTDALIESLEQLITKKRQIKQGAMQELLTGKRRLPGFEVKPGYKHTEVGVIPEDWIIIPLVSVTPPNIKNGIVDGPFGSNLKTIHYRNSGIPIITSGYVTDGYFRAEKYLYVNQTKFNQEKRSAVQPGDIVMAKIGERCGSSAILPLNHETGILSGNALKITVDSVKYSTVYIWQILWNLYSSGNIELLKTTGAQPAISMTSLKKHKITLPPTKTEQTAIATILSDMDAEITTLEEKLVKTRQIKQGMMQELLTGRIRLV